MDSLDTTKKVEREGIGWRAGEMILYQAVPPGLFHELQVLDDGEVVDHLRNHLGNFLLDPVVAKVYLARFLRNEESMQKTLAWIRYLADKICELDPFDQDVRRFRQSITGKPDPLLPAIEKYNSPKHIKSQWQSLSCQSPDIQRRALWSHLKAYPYSVDLIQRAFMLDFVENRPIGKDWPQEVQIPTECLPLFNELLMRLCFIQGDIERAYTYYEKTKNNRPHSARWLCDAAEIAYATGRPSLALDLYRASLRADPLQTAVRYRMKQIAHPLHIDHRFLQEVSVAIFLYSYNKCHLLRNTLLSLASSRIGRAHIVLLNGCTDDSLEMAERIGKEHFRDSFETIVLPVNIGAPAARNWLLNTPIGQTADYVAFLDDDVEIPPDWLATFLTVLRNHPRAGVVGAKVLYPGRPRRLQYLYRNIAVAKEGLIRLSLSEPNFNYDTRTYDFVRPTTNVMGCCHVFTRKALDEVGEFDIRFSPSQMDDIAHDLDLRIHGFEVIYCGLVECIHHQTSGVGLNTKADLQKIGNVMGNDVKFFYRFFPHLAFLKSENNVQNKSYAGTNIYAQEITT